MADTLKESEQQFADWMESVEFISTGGKITTPKIGPDKSSDPDNDRE